jgi:hypothetical protein
MVLVPLDVKPDTPAVAEAVHEKVAPATSDVRVISVLLSPEQMVCDSGELLTVGAGSMVRFLVEKTLPQGEFPFAVKVRVTLPAEISAKLGV